MSALEVDPQSFLFVAQADVADCFHRMCLPPSLRGFFGLPVIEARDLGIKHFNGMPVSPGDMIVPRCCALPMGFTWSLFVRIARARTCA